MELIRPDWAAPARVNALVTTRSFGDMGGEDRAKLRALLPAEPAWLQQVHGVNVVEASAATGKPKADACVARSLGAVCVVMAADCMPVLVCDRAGTAVGAAHAGWRGLCAGVIEATISRMGIHGKDLLAWLGPAIGPRAYEVGMEVRDAFLHGHPEAAAAFLPGRPGHCFADLYALARQRLGKTGIMSIHGGHFCTFTEDERFFSYRRDGETGRMASLIWLAR
jgi:YfiH family protein